MTLREAEAATGIPVNTLRKWVRKSGLESYLESDGDTPVRMVDLDAVKRRAESLGRDIAPVEPVSAASARNDAASGRADASAARAIREDAAGTLSSEAPSAETVLPETMPPETMPPETMPPETMIVPIDAWNKMLNQLGNLHEAGQQLADARERAAKAETEAAFLRQRLAELRDDEPDMDGSGRTSDTDADTDTDADEPVPASTPVWRYVARQWRRRTPRSRS